MFILVGTKKDLCSGTAIENAALYASQIHTPFFVTSAKNNELGTLFYHVSIKKFNCD